MSRKDNAEQTVQLCEQIIQQAPPRRLLDAYRSVVEILWLVFLKQANPLDSSDRITESLEDRRNIKQEIIHTLEMYCVQNGLPLRIRLDDYQPDIERPPIEQGP